MACLEFVTRRKRKSRKAKEDIGINNYNGFFLQVPSYMYDFLASFGMHGIGMCVYGPLVINGMGFSRCDSGYNLAFPFPDSHRVMGFSCFGLDGFPYGFEAK